eukprot:1159140-Pelagomonas_calceolata.AAC.2
MDLSVRPCTPNWQAAAINAELLARRQENVLLLLALLEDEPVSDSQVIKADLNCLVMQTRNAEQCQLVCLMLPLKWKGTRRVIDRRM